MRYSLPSHDLAGVLIIVKSFKKFFHYKFYSFKGWQLSIGEYSLDIRVAQHSRSMNINGCGQAVSANFWALIKR